MRGTGASGAETVPHGRIAFVTSPSVVQSGAFRENGEKTFFPAIAADGNDAVFVYNTASPEGDGDGYVDIGVAVIDDGRIAQYETVKDGANDYDSVDPGEGDQGTQTLRWGDYNGAVPDSNGDGFWVVSQYAKQVELEEPLDKEYLEDNFYGTRIAKVTVSES